MKSHGVIHRGNGITGVPLKGEVVTEMNEIILMRFCVRIKPVVRIIYVLVLHVDDEASR